MLISMVPSDLGKTLYRQLGFLSLVEEERMLGFHIDRALKRRMRRESVCL